MTTPVPDLVSTDWLAAHLTLSGLAVLDASHHLPAAERDAKADFAAGHIPGAQFLGLASLIDEGSSVPQALPRPDQLAARLGLLGVEPGDTIILYDDSAIRTSARAWFMLHASGWENVAILDGGLAKWRSEGQPLEVGITHPAPVSPTTLAPLGGVRSKAQMLANIETRAEQVLDARSADRVFGTGTDPVHGLPMGRIPGALNLPFTDVLNADGTYRSPAELRDIFTAAGIDLHRPITTSCGSGITASVLMFALHLIGVKDAALYDGSWSEWGADPATPKEQGLAQGPAQGPVA